MPSMRLPDAAFGISAWTDLTQSGSSIESRKDVDVVVRERSMLDGLLDDTTRVTAMVREAGGEVVEEIWPEMFHVWHAAAPMLPEGQRAVERIGEFVMAQIGARVSGD